MGKKIIMGLDSVDRTITRLSHEILETNNNNDQIALIGIHRRGVYLALRIKNKIKQISGFELNTGSLDITFHRDDYRERLVVPKVKGTDISFSLEGKVVVLIDDVLYTGRTIRASLDEMIVGGGMGRSRTQALEALAAVNVGSEGFAAMRDANAAATPPSVTNNITNAMSNTGGTTNIFNDAGSIDRSLLEQAMIAGQ